MKDFIKKYWGIIVAVLGALFVGASVTASRQRKKDARKTKKDLRATKKDINKVQDNARDIAKQQEVAKKVLADSDKRVNTLHTQVNNVSVDNKDVDEAVNHLKGI